MTTTPPPSPIPTYAPGTELYGMLSVTGEVVVEPKYEYLDLFSEEGLARFCDHGRWGFVNTDGEEVIPAQFEDANNFSEGLAAVKIDGLWGFIDETGEMVIEPRFEGVDGGFKYGRCVFFEGDKCGFIDGAGMVIEEPQFLEIRSVTDKYYIVTSPGKLYGVIDRDGNMVLEPQVKHIEHVAPEGYIFFPAFWETEKNNDASEAVPFVKLDSENGRVIYDLQEEKSIHYYAIPSFLTGEKWDRNEEVLRGPYIQASVLGEVFVETAPNYGVYDLRVGEFVTERVFTHVDKIVCIDGDFYALTEILSKRGLISLSSSKNILNNEYVYIVSSPSNQFAANVGNEYCVVFDGEGKELYRTNSGHMICDYLPSFQCWLFMSSDYEGLISMEGEVVYQCDDRHQWFRDGTLYMKNDDGYIIFIDPDFQLLERGPYQSFIDQTRSSKMIIAYDESGRTDIISIRGDILFSNVETISYIDGDEEYFVFTQKME